MQTEVGARGRPAPVEATKQPRNQRLNYIWCKEQRCPWRHCPQIRQCSLLQGRKHRRRTKSSSNEGLRSEICEFFAEKIPSRV